MIFNEEAEILDDSYHFISNVFLKTYSEGDRVLVSAIPRSMNSTPIIFEKNKFFHVILTNFEKIYFFKVIFSKIEQIDDAPCYLYKVVDEKSMINNRKEKRENVSFQGVSTDSQRIHIIQVLDISPSGIKIETSEAIQSEFVDVIFEENGKKRVERGRVMWAKRSPNEKFFLFGIEFQLKKTS